MRGRYYLSLRGDTYKQEGHRMNDPLWLLERWHKKVLIKGWRKNLECRDILLTDVHSQKVVFTLDELRSLDNLKSLWGLSSYYLPFTGSPTQYFSFMSNLETFFSLWDPKQKIHSFGCVMYLEGPYLRINLKIYTKTEDLISPVSLVNIK